MSGVRTSPRGDIWARKRRVWSTEQKTAIVTEIDVDGATLSEVARRHGLHVNVLFRGARGYRVASSGNMTDEVWKEYIKNQTPPEPDDDFKVV